MPGELKLSVGQFSGRGRKEVNQDFHGACVPKAHQLASKGIAIAIADGIGSSQVSQVASQFAVTSILEDYYCTSEAWSVQTSVERVLAATNSWLHSQTQKSQYRHDMDRGYVCALSALVFKSNTAHLFHVGDTRVYQVRGQSLEPLTTDHRTWVSSEQSYLSRALGMAWAARSRSPPWPASTPAMNSGATCSYTPSVASTKMSPASTGCVR